MRNPARRECATLGSRCTRAQSAARSIFRLGGASTDRWESPRPVHPTSTLASTRGAAARRGRKVDHAAASSVPPSRRPAVARSTPTPSCASHRRAARPRPAPPRAAVADRPAVAVAATLSLPVPPCPCFASPTLPIMLDHAVRNKLQGIYASINKVAHVLRNESDLISSRPTICNVCGQCGHTK